MSIATETRAVYGPGSEHSYWLDRLLATGHEPMVPYLSQRSGVSEHEATIRLAEAAQYAREQRNNDNVSVFGTAHGGTDFGLTTPSGHINEAMSGSYVAASHIEALHTRHPMPSNPGDVLKIPRVSTAPTTAVQSADGASESTTDPVSAIVSAPSQRWPGSSRCHGRRPIFSCGPVPRRSCRACSGIKLAEAVDLELMQGTALSGHTVGITKATGATATSYTDASPTVAEFVTAFHKAISTTKTARKIGGTGWSAIMHPRRAEWYYEADASACRWAARLGRKVGRYCRVHHRGHDPWRWHRGRRVSRPVGRLAVLGTETVIEVATDYSGLTNGQVAIAIRQYVVSPGTLLQPAGLGVLSGTGLAAVSGY